MFFHVLAQQIGRRGNQSIDLSQPLGWDDAVREHLGNGDCCLLGNASAAAQRSGSRQGSNIAEFVDIAFPFVHVTAHRGCHSLYVGHRQLQTFECFSIAV